MKKQDSTKNIPGMEGNVQRGVDFNLKKEDLMLLILEGRKEDMETTIAKLQQTKADALTEFNKLNDEFYQSVKTDLVKAMNREAKSLASNYGEGAKSFNVRIDTAQENISFKEFQSQVIKNSSGSSAGGTCVKGQVVSTISIQVPTRAIYSVSLSMVGKTFLDKNKFFKEEPIACRDSVNVTIKLGDQQLDKEVLMETPQFKAAKKAAEAYGDAATLLSEILTEYDLFCRNQPRAKAAMIKEVLGSDAAGQALLLNIQQAAKGVKLLG